MRRASPLGFPFAVIAALSIVGILSPPLLIALSVLAATLVLRHGLRRLAAGPRPAPPPLSTSEIQNLLRTQFRAQPQMRDTARKSEAQRLTAPRPGPAAAATRARPPYFASAAAALLLGIGVPLELGQGLGLGAAIMASACVFFLLAVAATRPARAPEPAALNALLDRALAFEPEPADATDSIADPNVTDESVSGEDALQEHRFHLQLPEDDGTDDAPPLRASLANPLRSPQRRAQE